MVRVDKNPSPPLRVDAPYGPTGDRQWTVAEGPCCLSWLSEATGNARSLFSPPTRVQHGETAGGALPSRRGVTKDEIKLLLGRGGDPNAAWLLKN